MEFWTRDITQKVLGCWACWFLMLYVCEGGGAIPPPSQSCTLNSSHFINEKLFVTLLILINMPGNADLAIDI